MKKILVLPAWLTGINFFKNSADYAIEIGRFDAEAIDADVVIGMSLGGLIVLKDAQRIKGKMIIINPPLPKRNIFAWLIRWTKYIFTEGSSADRQKFARNPFRYLAIFKCIGMLCDQDLVKNLDSATKERITVLRGVNDKFFCDNESVEFLKEHGIKVVEIQSGHNWSEVLEKWLGENL